MHLVDWSDRLRHNMSLSAPWVGIRTAWNHMDMQVHTYSMK